MCEYQSFESAFIGQVGLGVGSWTSNLTNVDSIPGEFDLNFVILLKNVEYMFD